VYDTIGDGYRLLDDGSAQGTTVVREGRSVTVPHGSRGIRLQSGDEIVLGEARVRVKIHRGTSSVRTSRVAT
jgi:predicted component of type VI protein secretion system